MGSFGTKIMADVEEAFNYFAAGDSMDLATFSKMARSLGQTPSGEEIATITAGSEAISLEQAKAFVEQMKPKTAERDEASIKEAFQAFDPEGTGYIKFGEFVNEVLSKGEPITAEEKAAILKNLDASGAHEPSHELGDMIKYEVYVQHVCKQLRK